MRVCFFLLFIFSSQVMGKIYHYNWEQKFYDLMKNQSTLLYAEAMNHSKLSFVDIDGDGDHDLFIGKEDGRIALFKNQGTSEQSKLTLVSKEIEGYFFKKQTKQGRSNPPQQLEKLIIDVGKYSAPSFADLDYDGDLDLIVGTGEGQLWFFKNIGNNLTHKFQFITSSFHNIKLGKKIVPLFSDINLDRRQDLIIGNKKGQLWLLINEGNLRKPLYDSKAYFIGKVNSGFNASPSLFDWDYDGDLDLIVGKNTGTLDYFSNQGDRFTPIWKLVKEDIQRIDIGGEAAPVFTSIDRTQDRKFSLLIGTSGSDVFHYEIFKDSVKEKEKPKTDQQNTPQNPVDNNPENQANNNTNQKVKTSTTPRYTSILWQVSTNYLNYFSFIRIGTRASIAVGDLDGDQDQDLIFGEASGNLNYYENAGSSQKPNWKLITEDMFAMTGIKNSAPVLGDLDGDQDLDLLIGQESGEVSFLENKGDAKKAIWELKEKAYFDIDVGSNSVPRLIDLDGDQDLDLFLGNYTGRLILYENKGTATKANFVLESTRYTSLKIQQNSVPSFFDWNQDQIHDVIVGSANGKLSMVLSGQVDGKFYWKPSSKFLSSIKTEQLSNPFFADINGDSKQDLFLTSYSGEVKLFLNQGFTLLEETEENKNKFTKKVSQVNKHSEETSSDDFKNIETIENVEALEDPNSNPNKSIIIDPQFSSTGIEILPPNQFQRPITTIGDLDQDGDFDLIVGTKFGVLWIIKNTGTPTQWSFDVQQAEKIKSKFQYLAPLLYDLDQDLDLDLVIGTKTGLLLYYENVGTPQQSRFLRKPNYFTNFRAGYNAAPSIYDVDQDGKFDLLVGNRKGTLFYVKNNTHQYQVISRFFYSMDVGLASSPHFSDINNDGIQELVLGSDKGNLFFYEKKFSKWKKTKKYSKPIKVHLGSYPILSDLDNDGDMDLIVSYENSQVLLYENTSI